MRSSVTRVSEAIGTMRISTFAAALVTLALCAAGHAQTLDKAKLDQFFDRLAEKNKGSFRRPATWPDSSTRCSKESWFQKRHSSA